MQELEKILKEVEAALKTMYLDVANNYDISDLHSDRDKKACVASRCRHVARELITEIFRKHMNDGWIPVKERLPEDDTIVIVTDQYGNVRGDIVYGYADEVDAEPCFHRWDDEYWQCYKPEVIAWRPLPEPYRPEKKE